MPHWRPTCPIGYQHAPLETDMPVETHWRPRCLRSPIRIHTHMFKYTYFYILFANLYTCRSPMGCQSRMSVSHEACWFQMGLRWSMLRSPFRHVGLQWVSDRSRIGLWWVSDGSPIIMIFSWTQKFTYAWVWYTFKPYRRGLEIKSVTSLIYIMYT